MISVSLRNPFDEGICEREASEMNLAEPRFHYQPYRAVVIEIVSIESLPKTGVFPVWAGDFRQILAQVADFKVSGDRSGMRKSP